MESLSNRVKGVVGFKEFSIEYFKCLTKLFEKIDIDKLESLAAEINEAREKGNTIFFAGNGGSAATASHFANDLGFGSRNHIDPSIKAISLSDNTAIVSALSNPSARAKNSVTGPFRCC